MTPDEILSNTFSLGALEMACVDGAMPTDLLWRY